MTSSNYTIINICNSRKICTFAAEFRDEKICTRTIDMNRMKRWMLMMAVMCQVAVYAQLSIGNPKEKFSLSATVDRVADSDYTWDTDENEDIADGRMKRTMSAKLKSNIKLVSGPLGSVSIAPFYNYSTTRLETEWKGVSMFDFPDKHHHYGATLSASMNMLLGSREHGKPMTILATTAPNFSENGFEQMSGVVGAMVYVTRTPQDYSRAGCHLSLWFTVVVAFVAVGHLSSSV